jgi:hypothetical protein
MNGAGQIVRNTCFSVSLWHQKMANCSDAKSRLPATFNSFGALKQRTFVRNHLYKTIRGIPVLLLEESEPTH